MRVRSRIKSAWTFTLPFEQVYFIYKLIWNIAAQDNRVARDAYTYRFNKPRKPGWTGRLRRPVYKVAACVVQSETIPTKSRRHVRRRNWYVHICIMHTCILHKSSSNRLARNLVCDCAIADLAAVTRNVFVLDESRSRSVKSIERDHARINTRSPIAPWHFPSRNHRRFETPSGRAASRTPTPVANHSVGQVEVGFRNINNWRFFDPSLTHAKVKAESFVQSIERALHDD